MRHGRALALALALAIAIAVAWLASPRTGSTPHGSQTPEPAPSPSSVGVLRGTLAPATPAQVARSLRWLAQLRTTTGQPTSTYRRAAFGSAWTDIDHNGCNQRDDVLLRDAEPGTTTVGQQGRCDHDVLAGAWTDPYGGQRIRLDDAKDARQSQQVQIDHLVPLEDAWRSGASRWTGQRRTTYANTLSVLVAAGGSANEAKGSKSPAEWVPLRQATRCPYAVAWIRVKHTWGLTVTDDERRSLALLLNRCPT